MSDPRFILALDQGTTSSRTIVFNEAGHAVVTAQSPTTQIFPRPGWVNQDATEIWQTQLATAREAVARAGIAMTDVASIGSRINARRSLYGTGLLASQSIRRSSGRAGKVRPRWMPCWRGGWDRPIRT
jgi:hypothetical protein